MTDAESHPKPPQQPAAQALEGSEWAFERGEEIVPGRFAVKRLGGGRRSEGYLCWEAELGALVVVKLLRPAATEQTKALRREAEVLASLDHPSLPQCFGAALEGPRPHLVLEHADGPQLSGLLRDGPLPPSGVVPWALEIAGALHHLAVKGIVHWDVKPDNIVLSSPAKLIDFGTARRREEPKVDGRAHEARSSRYKAPEHCEPGVRPRRWAPADVWGLGISMYEALAGAQPFPKRGEGEQAPQLQHEPAPLPTALPRELAAIVLACLRREPEERLTAGEAAARLQPLAAALSAEPRGLRYLRRLARMVR